MTELLPIAKLGEQVLIINRDDLPYVGQNRAMEVMCVQVDFRHKTIAPPLELEKHLKFNPWEEVSKSDRDVIIGRLKDNFSSSDLEEKVVKRLAEHLIK